MNLLFLRGQVPTDRPKEQIMFNTIEECDDMWSQLAYNFSKNSYGEIWYYGNTTRTTQYKQNFIERWIPNLDTYNSSFQPDIIFARGGFKQYDNTLKKYPKAYKIYYGAGKRFIPQTNPKLYNLILVDTPKQQEKAKSKLPKSNIQLFIKPAADNVFIPISNTKKYDVIFSSNQHPSGIKGHNFILPLFPKHLKMVQLGIVEEKLKLKYPHIEFTGWIPRKEHSQYYSQAKLAVICCESIDSCPRVISEALACNCPILVLDTVNIWKEKYINEQTGKMTSKKNFISEMIKMIDDCHKFDPYKPYIYYKSNLSLQVATNYLKRLISF